MVNAQMLDVDVDLGESTTDDQVERAMDTVQVQSTVYSINRETRTAIERRAPWTTSSNKMAKTRG